MFVLLTQRLRLDQCSVIFYAMEIWASLGLQSPPIAVGRLRIPAHLAGMPADPGAPSITKDFKLCPPLGINIAIAPLRASSSSRQTVFSALKIFQKHLQLTETKKLPRTKQVDNDFRNTITVHATGIHLLAYINISKNALFNTYFLYCAHIKHKTFQVEDNHCPRTFTPIFEQSWILGDQDTGSCCLFLWAFHAKHDTNTFVERSWDDWRGFATTAVLPRSSRVKIRLRVT